MGLFKGYLSVLITQPSSPRVSDTRESRAEALTSFLSCLGSHMVSLLLLFFFHEKQVTKSSGPHSKRGELGFICRRKDCKRISGHILNPLKSENKGKVLVTQSCLTVCHPMDFSPPGSSVHGILQASILRWVDIPFSRGSSLPRDQSRVRSPAL